MMVQRSAVNNPANEITKNPYLYPRGQKRKAQTRKEKISFQSEAILHDLCSWTESMLPRALNYHTAIAYMVSRVKSQTVSWSTPGSVPEGLAGLNRSSLCQLVHSCVKFSREKGGHGCGGESRVSNGMLTRSLNALHPLSLCPLCFNYARAPYKSTV